MSGSCIIYDRVDNKDAMGVPSKIFTHQRIGNIYPLACSLQEVDRVAQSSEAGSRFEVSTDYNLKLPWGTIVSKGDQIVITDDLGRTVRIHVLDPYYHTSGLSLIIRCKDIS